MTPEQVLVKQLGALPVIREYLERLRVKECVDALAPVREVAALTNGEVVVALVANRLTAPQPLDRIEEWAARWAVAEVWGIAPAQLNDDRLGRCLDDLAAIHDRLRGDLTVQAVAAFGVETKAIRWDLTSVVVTGEYPPEEQDPGYAQVGYGDGGGQHKQVRYLQATSTDGAVPLWDQVYDGKTADVATVIATMQALREHARCSDFVLIGDSKLLSAANRQALLRAQIGYLAPLPRTPELDEACLAIPPEQWVPLAYVSARERGQPPAERTTDHGHETTVVVAVPDAAGRVTMVPVRRLFVRSSEEQAACRRNRERQRARAEAEIGKVLRQVGTRWYPTVERAQAKIEAILDQRHLRPLYQVTPTHDQGRPTVAVTLDPAALARAEALDGYDVLETPRPAGPGADATAVLAEWKGQWQVEHRHRAAKGPLRVRPLFVLSNRRIVGLITILGIALLVFSLIERAARQALAPAEKVPHLLAGHVAARPTGDNLLTALQPIALVTLVAAHEIQHLIADLTPLQRTVLRLLAVPELSYQRFARPPTPDLSFMCERQA